MSVYILHSDTINQYYVGSTANLDDRFQRHNQGRSKSTKKGVPWDLVISIEVNDCSVAVLLAQRIKKRGAQRWLFDNQEPHTSG